ncbi:CFI-box-CTERM domain-containing protein [Bacillus luti]|uniref:CFI-box-CTERM domain-containing protein n=1 Tax=Bacillus luti TaxID=2026191 RepID=UPI003774E787
MSKGIGGSTGTGRTKGIGGNVGSQSKGIGGNVGSHSKGIGGNTRNSNPAPPSNQPSNNNHNNSDCFVATAAFGTPWEQEIQVLRNWRDNSLRYSTSGRAFIKFYYKRGPIVASLIRKYPILRAPVRVVIRSIVKFMK